MTDLCCVISIADVPYIDKFISVYLSRDITLTSYIVNNPTFREHLESTVLFLVEGDSLNWYYVTSFNNDGWESELNKSIPVPIEFFQNPSAFPELLVFLQVES